MELVGLLLELFSRLTCHDPGLDGLDLGLDVGLVCHDLGLLSKNLRLTHILQNSDFLPPLQTLNHCSHL